MAQEHPLKKFRQDQKPPWSQDDLAERLDVTKAAVSRWETGERFPERETWPLIEKLTGLTSDDLAKALEPEEEKRPRSSARESAR